MRISLVRASGRSIFMLSNLTAIQSYFYPVSKTSNFNVNIIPIKLNRFVDHFIARIISRSLFIRDHSRNQPNGGHKRNSPQCSTTTRFLWPSLSVYAHKEPLQRTLPNVFCTKLRLNHRVRVGLKSRHNHVFAKKIIWSRSKGGLATTTTHS